MEKKIRVTLPEYIYNTLKGDIEEFSINKNRLCNYIFQRSDYTALKESLPDTREKTTIQFNLNKVNLENYYSILEENNIQVEAEFFRRVFYTYTSKNQNEREKFIFEDILKKIDYSIKEKRTMRITFIDGKNTKITPYYLGSSKLKLSNYLFSYDHNLREYKNYKLCYIKSVFILQEEGHGGDRKFIKEVISNFDPFLSKGKYISVALTPKGVEMLNQLKTNRPKIIGNEGNIYRFECSHEKARRYFTYFLAEARITEPAELADWFKEELYKAYKNYL